MIKRGFLFGTSWPRLVCVQGIFARFFSAFPQASNNPRFIREKTPSAFIATLQANMALKRSRIWLPLIAVLLCSACGKSPKPVATSAVSSASASEAPAFKIAEEQRKALEQAKQLEQDLQKAAEKQRRAIEDATDANK